MTSTTTSQHQAPPKQTASVLPLLKYDAWWTSTGLHDKASRNVFVAHPLSSSSVLIPYKAALRTIRERFVLLYAE
jgi:hypothetical protein